MSQRATNTLIDGSTLAPSRQDLDPKDRSTHEVVLRAILEVWGEMQISGL
jgi:hypothetical protein